MGGESASTASRAAGGAKFALALALALADAFAASSALAPELVVQPSAPTARATVAAMPKIRPHSTKRR